MKLDFKKNKKTLNRCSISNSVCSIPNNIECRFRNKKYECTSLGDCLKANAF